MFYYKFALYVEVSTLKKFILCVINILSDKNTIFHVRKGGPLGVLDGSVDDRGVKMEETDVFFISFEAIWTNFCFGDSL